MTLYDGIGVTKRPAAELARLREEVFALKKKLNAVIVAHNYQVPEVQDIADFVGDSLELARRSAELKAETIVFCGVDFMAETAAIVNPDATVLLSSIAACCPMAAMIDKNKLDEWKKKYPKAAVVSYVNTTAAVKAGSDICCTSANAVKVVESLPNDEVLFVPDRNLGHYVSTKTKKKMILYPGYCVTHDRLTAEEVKMARLRRCGFKHFSDNPLRQRESGDNLPYRHGGWAPPPDVSGQPAKTLLPDFSQPYLPQDEKDTAGNGHRDDETEEKPYHRT
jgi:quinolinate synthase